jgi:hypothetical protein
VLSKTHPAHGSRESESTVNSGGCCRLCRVYAGRQRWATCDVLYGCTPTQVAQCPAV